MSVSRGCLIANVIPLLKIQKKSRVLGASAFVAALNNSHVLRFTAEFWTSTLAKMVNIAIFDYLLNMVKYNLGFPITVFALKGQSSKSDSSLHTKRLYTAVTKCHWWPSVKGKHFTYFCFHLFIPRYNFIYIWLVNYMKIKPYLHHNPNPWCKSCVNPNQYGL